MVEVLRANQEHLSRYLPRPTKDYDRAAADAFIRQAQRQYAAGGQLTLGIWEHGQLVGGIGMNNTQWEHRATSLGYWLAESAQGRGIMTRVARSVVDEPLRRRGYNRVVIAVQPDNEASRAVAERLGFQLEGVSRQVHRHGGYFVDWAIYAMLAPDWGDR